jgi:hypothetical protein
MTARVPKVGEKGWKCGDGWTSCEVEIVAVVDDYVWVRRPKDTYGNLFQVAELTPPEPTVTMTRWISQRPHPTNRLPTAIMTHDDVEAEAKLERLSDGTWRVTNLKDGG